MHRGLPVLVWKQAEQGSVSRTAGSSSTGSSEPPIDAMIKLMQDLEMQYHDMMHECTMHKVGTQ